MADSTFLGVPSGTTGDIAILGIPFGVPYPDPGLTAGCAEAPAAIRARSQRLARFTSSFDFDMDGPMLPAGSTLRLVDAGDVPGSPSDGPGNAARAEAAVRSLVEAGGIPILFGGDDSIPIPALRAFADGPIQVLQVDAHLDFRHEVDGVREGYSSPMRRASELPQVGRIYQVGLRGVGSASAGDVADARAAGNLLITADEVREHGIDGIVEQLPPGAPLFIAFDVDGLDPAVAPAVSGLSPGGLDYRDASRLLTGAATRCSVVGAAFTEYVPALDVNGLTALVVVRLAMQLIGALARR
jgi:agmatinase